jgi:urease accessory protein
VFAAISRSESGAARGLVALERANGAVRLGFHAQHGLSRLSVMFQQGSARARLPRTADGVPEAVLMNIAGGLTGGDRMSYAVEVGAGAAAAVTTQAGEKIYRARDGAAEVQVRLTLGGGARAEWLPQETILFEGARLRRRLDVDMAENASLLAVEALVFGRTARGESMRTGLVHDQWRVRRGGRLVFADGLRLDGQVASRLARPALLAGGCAAATVLLVAPDAESRLDAARAALDGAPAEGGVSAWDGLLASRLAAQDGAALRTTVVALLAALRGGRPLPRVWQC